MKCIENKKHCEFLKKINICVRCKRFYKNNPDDLEDLFFYINKSIIDKYKGVKR